jgi:hypothetical protein
MMANMIEVDVWVRGTNQARTEKLSGLPENAAEWTDTDVRRLLTEMLLALERTQNPGGEPPAVNLRGFSWIVSPDDAIPSARPASSDGRRGVLVHLEMKMGTASAGPFAIDEASLSEMITRVMAAPIGASTVH